MSLPGIAEGFTDQGALTPENLIAGTFPRITRVVSVTGGEALSVGAVLGRITATGQYVLSQVEAGDGSEVPDAILAEAVDTTSVDVLAHAYLAGEFNALSLTFGVSHTIATITDAFRRKSIFLRNNQA